MLPLSNALVGRNRLLVAVASTAHQNMIYPLTQRLQQPPQQQQQQQQPQQSRSMGHLVRVILREDLPGGKGRVREVVEVPAGYARNCLIPQKKALYASDENLKKLAEAHEILGTTPAEPSSSAVVVGIPLNNTKTSTTTVIKPTKISVPSKKKQKNKASPNMQKIPDDFLAAARLKHYLRNKHLKLFRNIDPTTRSITPGMVDATAVREKLSKQLRIDLEENETVHLSVENISSYDKDWRRPGYLEEIIENISTGQPCTVQIRQLGFYVAKLTLSGGYVVPLVVQIVKR